MGALLGGGEGGGLLGGLGGLLGGGQGGGGGGGLGGMATSLITGGGTSPTAGGLDIQAHRLPIVGAFFGNPAEQHQMQQMDMAARTYGAYRPEMAQAQMNSLRNLGSIYQGTNNLLATAGGGQGGVNMGQAYQSPMGPTMMQQGQPMSQQPGFLGPQGFGR